MGFTQSGQAPTIYDVSAGVSKDFWEYFGKDPSDITGSSGIQYWVRYEDKHYLIALPEMEGTIPGSQIMRLLIDQKIDLYDITDIDQPIQLKSEKMEQYFYEMIREPLIFLKLFYQADTDDFIYRPSFLSAIREQNAKRMVEWTQIRRIALNASEILRPLGLSQTALGLFQYSLLSVLSIGSEAIHQAEYQSLVNSFEHIEERIDTLMKNGQSEQLYEEYPLAKIGQAAGFLETGISLSESTYNIGKQIYLYQISRDLSTYLGIDFINHSTRYINSSGKLSDLAKNIISSTKIAGEVLSILTTLVKTDTAQAQISGLRIAYNLEMMSRLLETQNTLLEKLCPDPKSEAIKTEHMAAYKQAKILSAYIEWETYELIKAYGKPEGISLVHRLFYAVDHHLLGGAQRQIDIDTLMTHIETENRILTIPNQQYLPGKSLSIQITDPNLEQAIREAEGYTGPANGPIRAQDVHTITRLYAINANIHSLEGIEHLQSLTDLQLRENAISDLSPLQTLSQLEYLRLEKNQITDITALTGLTKLKILNLSENQIQDIQALAGLSALKEINLVKNKIQDLTPLKNLSQLERLLLSYNELKNIEPLQNLTALEQLNLWNNNISDIRILEHLPALKEIGLGHNAITNLTPLVDNENLGAGVSVDVRHNLLDTGEGKADKRAIETLEGRGVKVIGGGDKETFPYAGEMVLVKGGTFQMGDEHGDLWDPCRPVHTVKLTYDYYIGITEVTFNAYDAYCEATGKSKIGNLSLFERDIKPVNDLSWYDAINYCNWLSEQEGLAKAYNGKGSFLDINGRQTRDITQVEGYRLPTEAEWEYAARGGHKSTRDFNYAGSNDIEEVGWYISNSRGEWNQGELKTVGQKVPNELGLYDMSGNVWEWCHDYWNDNWWEFNYYENSSEENPVNHISSPQRVTRGGSIYRGEDECRVAFRAANEASAHFFGFRIVRTDVKIAKNVNEKQKNFFPYAGEMVLVKGNSEKSELKEKTGTRLEYTLITDEFYDMENNLLLDEIVSIIKDRFDYAGYTEIEVTCSKNSENTILSFEVPHMIYALNDIKTLVKLFTKRGYFFFGEILDQVGSDMKPAEKTGLLKYPHQNGNDTFFYLVRDYIVIGSQRYYLNNSSISDVEFSQDNQRGGNKISFTFDKEGGELFEFITSNKLGHQLPIVLDDVVLAAPVIEQAIRGGKVDLSSRISLQEAFEIMPIIKSKPLPISFKLLRKGKMMYGESTQIDNTKIFYMGNIMNTSNTSHTSENLNPILLDYTYYLGNFKVTFNEYDTYCEETGKNKPNDSGWGRGNISVTNVSWWDAIEYCNWLSEKNELAKAYDSRGNLLDKNGNPTRDITQVEGYRLSTEAEWEYAARKIYETRFKNSNELFFYDMTDEIMEWCYDWFAWYTSDIKLNPIGPFVSNSHNTSHIIRGGCDDSQEDDCFVFIRNHNGPDKKSSALGFRIARTVIE